MLNKLSPLTQKRIHRVRSVLTPPQVSFVRAGMRLSVAGVLYLLGAQHAAITVAVMSVVLLTAPLESQVAKEMLKVAEARKLFDRFKRKSEPDRADEDE
jgi:hypothetical protein